MGLVSVRLRHDPDGFNRIYRSFVKHPNRIDSAERRETVALITCPDCRRQLSDQAPACPSCGRPTKMTRRAPPARRTAGGCGSVLVGFVAIAVIGITALYIIGTIGSHNARSRSRSRNTTSSPRTATLYNTASSLNVRSEPRADADVVGTLGFGERVQTTSGSETRNGEHTWIKIKQGWVVKQYLSEDRPLSEREQLAGPRPEQSGWDGSYPEVKRYLRQAMHDPSSLEWEGCTKVFWESTKEGYLVGCTYRGNNAFGAKIKNAHWFIIRHGQVVEAAEADAYEWR